MADVLLGGVGKIVHPAGGGESCHGAHAHGVHHALHGDLAQLHRGLLHGTGPAVADDLPQQGSVKDEPAPAQLQNGHFPADVERAQQAAQGLAQHGGEGAALGAPAQHLHKEQVAEDVQHRADHQKVQRTLAVAQRPHDSGQKIIEKRKDKAGEYDA